MMVQHSLIEDLRSGQLTLPEYLSQVESRFIEREPSILAFIPEEDRFTRLHTDADALVSRYPDLINRPLLFGALAGVKDIFHVEDSQLRREVVCHLKRCRVEKLRAFPS